MRYRRYKTAREGGRNIQKGRTTRMIYSKKVVWMVRKRYDKEYWARLERNWRRWKEGKTRGQKTMETIKEEEEEIEQESSGIKEWTEEDDEKMDNMVDPYYEL